MAVDSQNTILERSSIWDWKSKDAYIDSMYLMASPTKLLLIVLAYLLIVVGGPRLMMNRAPMKLNKAILFYNVFQVILSGYIVVMIVRGLKVFQDGVLLAGCRYSAESNDPQLLHLTWVYFVQKVTELLDTVFFVLRKKYNQITMLHVYHHLSMVVYMWCYLKYAAGGDGAILAFFNCIIHVIMYSYYLVAALGERFHKYLWWKKYVTKLQLIQFVIMLAYLIWTRFSQNCRFSKTFNSIIFANISIYLILFLNFYYQSYKNINRDVKKCL